MRELIKDQIDPVFLQYVRDNIDTRVDRLLLSSQMEDEIDLKKVASQIQSLRKAKKKIPTWFQNNQILFPPKISMEQCSSERTAEFKASFFSGDAILDMTAGAGIDTYFFSKRFKSILAIEKDPLLAAITDYNLEKLGASNVKLINEDSLSFLERSNKVFNLIYVDPARRGDSDNRLFKLQDCVPDVVANKRLLLDHSKQILIKAAPLLDIKEAINELGSVDQVFVISLKNEVKEVLYLVSENGKSPLIKTFNLKENEIEKFEFSFDQRVVKPVVGDIKEYIYEPNASILKSGGMDLLGQVKNLQKLSLNTQLYTSSQLVEDFPGRIFKVVQILSGSSKSIKKYLLNQRANIISRNYPLNAEQIANRFKISSQNEDSYLIFTKSRDTNTIIESRKVSD